MKLFNKSKMCSLKMWVKLIYSGDYYSRVSNGTFVLLLPVTPKFLLNVSEISSFLIT